MSRGTNHNAHNRVRQRAREEEEFQNHDPAVLSYRAKKAKEAAERAKGRMDFCSVCKETFRSNSTEVGIFVCPKSQSKTKPSMDDDVA